MNRASKVSILPWDFEGRCKVYLTKSTASFTFSP
jgi:hypothetical protein